MNRALFPLLTFALLSFVSCKDDDGDVTSYDYHSHILQPSSSDKSMGETLFIHVEFESHTGENVEHINVRIRNKANTAEVYNMPADPHLSGGVSVYEFQDQVVLSAANGFSAGDWVMTATVWGEDEGQDLETETVEFHIHP